ncbi:MAG: outer membrane beta-barrel protein [Hyphomicrobium sp.]|nr:outer membrane beta-barrel protein [Hyphomicrobium sp.]
MGDRRIAWFTVGLSVALLLGALGASAHAQDRPRATIDSGSAPSGFNRVRGTDQNLDDAYAAPGIPPPIPQDDPGEVQPEQDGMDPVPRAGQRPVVQDGDLTADDGPTQLRDGIVDVGEPLPPEDGTDPSTVDTRPPEDVAIFENPPAGHDPLLFQIEDIDPVRDNRATTRLFRREPYDPVGIKIGTFVMFPELEIGGSWYSNVFRAPKSLSDKAFDLKPSTRLVSNWSRHALEFRATGGFSYFSEYDTENDKSYLVETRGRLDIARRTNLQAVLSHEQTPESRSALDASSVGTRAKQTIERAEISLNHRFNRLSMQLRGGVSDFAYGDTQNLGAITSNDDRGYTQTEQAVRATWELKPTLSVFSEVAINQRNYDTAAATDLINRSSDGARYRAGLSFGNTGQILRGEVSLGYGVQAPDDERLSAIDGLIFDANATWRPAELTSVLLTARSDVSETTTAGVGGSFARSAGIEVRHSVRKYLIASAGLTYSTQNSEDGTINEGELRSTLGLEYFLNRDAILYGRYAHASFDAVGSASDYESDEVHLGLRIRR